MTTLTSPSNIGIFITFEGTEGAGKSTLISHLKSALEPEMEVVVTREPGGPGVSEKIRDLILDNEMHPLTELLLYEASRSEHVELVIRPALKRGAIVLCDRFTDSTLAYQGAARGIEASKIEALNTIATSGLIPHLTFWLDVDPEKGLSRATEHNRFEKEGVEFQKKVRQAFESLSLKNPARWLRLDSSQLSPKKLTEKAIARIDALLRQP